MNAVHTPQSIGLFALTHGDITPPVGLYHRMWGAATHDRSEGVHRPLRATALVLGSSDNGSSDWQAIVAIDHCINRPEPSIGFGHGRDRDPEAWLVYLLEHAQARNGSRRNSLICRHICGP